MSDDAEFYRELDALGRVCPACGAPAEWPDCVGCGHDFTAPKEEATPEAGSACPDLREAARFLALLDAEAETFEFRTFDDSPAKRGELARKLTGTLAEHAATLAELSARGAGVFVVINAGGQRSADIDRVRAVFADTDGAPLEPILSCGTEPHAVVESSQGKWHAYWLVDGLPLNELGPIQRAIAAKFGTDPSVCDLPRVMRLPGFDHRKGEPHRVRIIHESGGLAYSAERVRAAFASHAAATGQASGAIAADARAGVSSGNAALIRNVLTGVNLHDSTRDLAFRLVDDGLAPAKVVEIVRGVMEAMPERGDAGRWRERYADINRMVAGAVAKTATAPAAPSGWRLDRVGTLLDQPAPTRWLVRGVFDQGSLACLFGASGSGKSFVAVDLAASIATGALWHAHTVTQGAVVYMAGEGHHGLRKRFLAWSREHATDLAGAPLFVSSAAIDVSGSHAHVVAAIKQHCDRPALVIIDTLHRHLPPGGDDSATTDMGALVAGADAIREALGCAVLLVHHTGHAASDRERGSSVLRGALDWSYSLQKGDAGPLILQCRKAKDHELPEPMQFALHSVELPWLDDEGEHEVSAVLRTTGTTEAGMGGNQLLAMTKLRRMAYDAKGEPVTVKDWRNESGVDRRRWREVVASLVERGQIFIEGDHVRLLEPAT